MNKRFYFSTVFILLYACNNKMNRNDTTKAKENSNVEPKIGLPSTDGNNATTGTNPTTSTNPITGSKTVAPGNGIHLKIDSEKEKSTTDSEKEKPTTDSEKEKPTTDSEKEKPITDSEKEKPTTDKTIFTLLTTTHQDLVRQFCPNDNYGSLLVGGAYVIPNAVKWNGSSTIVISLTSNSENFGFIGKTNFLTYKKNEWRLITSSSEVDAVDLSSSSPAMGFYFAPRLAGDFTGTITYETSVLADNERSKAVSGSAKNDSPTNPLLTLNTTIAENYTSRPCQDGTTYCTEIDVPINRQVTFQVTPKFDSNQARQQNISALSYAKVTLDITESKVNCPPYSPSFYDSATANYSSDTYFDMMNGLDSMYPVSVQTRCNRQRDFLASTNKTFNFNATAVSNTETGKYAQYLFYIAGHYDVKNPTNYPGSYQIFRLRSGN